MLVANSPRLATRVFENIGPRLNNGGYCPQRTNAASDALNSRGFSRMARAARYQAARRLSALLRPRQAVARRRQCCLAQTGRRGNDDACSWRCGAGRLGVDSPGRAVVLLSLAIQQTDRALPWYRPPPAFGSDMEDEFAELFLKWTPQAQRSIAEEWLKGRGFTATQTPSGLFVLATKSQIETIFAVSLEDIRRPAKLPVPKELKDHIASVTLPVPRSYQ